MSSVGSEHPTDKIARSKSGEKRVRPGARLWTPSRPDFAAVVGLENKNEQQDDQQDRNDTAANVHVASPFKPFRFHSATLAERSPVGADFR